MHSSIMENRITKLYNIGLIAGNFDIIHPGYIEMFNIMKNLCKEVYVCLQGDPTIERPNKMKPILTLKERKNILSSLKQIDRIEYYNTEDEFYNLLIAIRPNVRFLGDDYKGRTDYTGYDLDIPIHYLNRDHGWSSTKFKDEIFRQVYKKYKHLGEI
jgi:glycerol-3-phosphate cytidylyltransferase